jgi:hypothetical protein
MKQSQKIILHTAPLITARSLIPAKAGIQKNTVLPRLKYGAAPYPLRVKPGMTNHVRLMSLCIGLTFIAACIWFGITLIEPVKAYGQSTGKISPFQESVRNPFVLPPGVHLLSEKEPKQTTLGKFENKPIAISPLPLKVKAILISDHIRLASIDRYIVTVGDLIYDEKVLEIKADQVILGKGDKKRTIFLDQSPIKLTVER